MKVSIICVSTLCGRISPAGLGSMEDRKRLERWRSITDASILGAASLRESDPEMRGPEGIILKDRLRAFITGSGKLPVDRKIFKTDPAPFIFCSKDQKQDLHEKFKNKARVIAIPANPNGSLSITKTLECLSEEGAHSCLIEGGGKLNFNALEEGVVDELIITLAPIVSGNRNEASLFDGEGFLNNCLIRLKLEESEVFQKTGEIFLRYTVRQ